MKFFLASLSILAALVLPAVYADTIADTPAALVVTLPAQVLTEVEEETVSDKQQENVLLDTFRRISWINGKPNRKAKYYIIVKMNITSYKMCAGGGRYERRTVKHLAREIAGIVKHHKDMCKDGRVELIFISGDESREYFRGCLKEFRAKCPGALLADDDVHKLPAMGELSRYFMGAALVRASDGSVVRTDRPLKLVADWKNALHVAEAAAGGRAE